MSPTRAPRPPRRRATPPASSPLTAAARAAADAVDPAGLAADLAALVRMPSVTGSEDAIAARLADLLEAAGMTVEVFHPDPADIRADPAWPGEEVARTTLPVVLARAGRPGGRRIVLSGHTDVVPAGDRSAWSRDPFSGDVVDGELDGRGACDMKGGVASILGALGALRDTGALARLAGELVVALVPSEEDGGQGTLAAIRAGAKGDMAVITEPTGLDVVVAHAGAITFRLSVPGRAAHASRRLEGVSALASLHTLLAALEADEAGRNAAEAEPLMAALGMPYPTMVGKVAGGEWASSVMDRVVAEGRYGVALGQTTAEAEAELRACIAEACAADPFLREHPASIEITGARFASSRVPGDHPLPSGLAAVAGAVTGRVPERAGVPYGCDMRLFINEGATPCVVYGPGDVRLAHGPDERVPLAEVEACARVLAAWVVEELGVVRGDRAP